MQGTGAGAGATAAAAAAAGLRWGVGCLALTAPKVPLEDPRHHLVLGACDGPGEGVLRGVGHPEELDGVPDKMNGGVE